MGVDYLICESCEDTFPDCGHFVRCECGKSWCSDRCADGDGYDYEYNKEKNMEFVSCNYCRGEDVEDHELLKAAMQKLGVDRKGMIEICKELSKDEEN